MNGLGLNRVGYYRFLRKIYGMGALEAWNYIKRVGTPPSINDVRTVISNKFAPPKFDNLRPYHDE